MKLRTVSVTLVTTLALCLVGQVAAQESPTDRPSREDVLHLFGVMHVRQQMETMMQKMTSVIREQRHETMKKQEPNITDDELSKQDAAFSDALAIYPPSEMVEDTIPIYQRHFSKADVEAITAFYVSPAGQHYVSESPSLMLDTMSMVMAKMSERLQAGTTKSPTQAVPPAQK
jgi:hypothetical protein